MAFNPAQYMTPYQPLDFGGLNQAIGNIQNARFRNAQLQEQMRQADMRQSQFETQQRMARQKAALGAEQWEAGHQLDLAKQQTLEAHRDLGHEEADERNLLSRQKAESGVLDQLRTGALKNYSDEELEAFAPQLASVGLSMRRASASPPQIDLPAPPPGVDPTQQIEFGRQLSDAAGEAAAEAAQDQVIEILRGEDVVQRIPLSRIRESQAGGVGTALGAMTEASSPIERAAFAGATDVAPVLRGTPKERIAQAEAFAHKRLGREAALRASRAGAGRASAADANRADLQYERGVKQFERTMGKLKNDETVNKLTLFREAIDKLQPGPDGKINPSSAMEAFYGIATAREGGRLTEGDFQRSFGFQDLLTKAENFLKTGTQAQLSDQQIKWTTEMIQKNYQDAVSKMKRDLRSAERLQSKLPEGARREGVEDMIDTVFGELPDYEAMAQQMQEAGAAEKQRETGAARSLLQKYGGG